MVSRLLPARPHHRRSESGRYRGRNRLGRLTRHPIRKDKGSGDSSKSNGGDFRRLSGFTRTIPTLTRRGVALRSRKATPSDCSGGARMTASARCVAVAGLDC
jgi:hypothetical protein